MFRFTPFRTSPSGSAVGGSQRTSASPTTTQPSTMRERLKQFQLQRQQNIQNTPKTPKTPGSDLKRRHSSAHVTRTPTISRTPFQSRQSMSSTPRPTTTDQATTNKEVSQRSPSRRDSSSSYISVFGSSSSRSESLANWEKERQARLNGDASFIAKRQASIRFTPTPHNKSITKTTKVRERSVKAKSVDLNLLIQCALDKAREGDIQQARELFQGMLSMSNLSIPASRSAYYWTSRAQAEELVGNYKEIVKIYEKAEFEFHAEPKSILNEGLRKFMASRIEESQENADGTLSCDIYFMNSRIFHTYSKFKRVRKVEKEKLKESIRLRTTPKSTVKRALLSPSRSLFSPNENNRPQRASNPQKTLVFCDDEADVDMFGNQNDSSQDNVTAGMNFSLSTVDQHSIEETSQSQQDESNEMASSQEEPEAIDPSDELMENPQDTSKTPMKTPSRLLTTKAPIFTPAPTYLTPQENISEMTPTTPVVSNLSDGEVNDIPDRFVTPRSSERKQSADKAKQELLGLKTVTFNTVFGSPSTAPISRTQTPFSKEKHSEEMDLELDSMQDSEEPVDSLESGIGSSPQGVNQTTSRRQSQHEVELHLEYCSYTPTRNTVHMDDPSTKEHSLRRELFADYEEETQVHEEPLEASIKLTSVQALEQPMGASSEMLACDDHETQVIVAEQVIQEEIPTASVEMIENVEPMETISNEVENVQRLDEPERMVLEQIITNIQEHEDCMETQVIEVPQSIQQEMELEVSPIAPNHEVFSCNVEQLAQNTSEITCTSPQVPPPESPITRHEPMASSQQTENAPLWLEFGAQIQNINYASSSVVESNNIRRSTISRKGTFDRSYTSCTYSKIQKRRKIPRVSKKIAKRKIGASYGY